MLARHARRARRRSRARGPVRAPRGAGRSVRPRTRSSPSHCTPRSRARLRARGIERLYAHQAAAIDALRERRSVVVATGTASGKSLCYQVPIVSSVVEEQARHRAAHLPDQGARAGPAARAALVARARAARGHLRRRHRGRRPRVGAQERERRAHQSRDAAHGHPPVAQAVGDVPHAAALRRRRRAAHAARDLRQSRRARAAPTATRLRALRRRSRRSASRARRSATRASSRPRCAGCRSSRSTTTRHRAPSACSRAGNARCSTSTPARAASANVETAELLTRFVRNGPPDARVHAQPARRRGRRAARPPAARDGCDPGLGDRVAAYRAGYLPEERRALEQALSSGTLLGIAATNALELGIDVGGLDAVILNGFPGTLASMWQQAGRAGRTGRRSAAVLVAGDDQLDQWYAAHPDELTRRPPERAVVNPQNPFVLRGAGRVRGARAAAARPTTNAGSAPGSTTRCASSCTPTCLKPRGGRMYWSGDHAARARRRAAHRIVGRVPAHRRAKRTA